MRIALFFVAVLILSPVAFATVDASDTSTGSNCGGSNAEMGECALADFRIEDARLNANYRKVVAELASRKDKDSAESLKALREAQRAWIKFRDANCDFQGSLFGNGSGRGLHVTARQLEMTRTRASDLEQLADSPEISP